MLDFIIFKVNLIFIIFFKYLQIFDLIANQKASSLRNKFENLASSREEEERVRAAEERAKRRQEEAAMLQDAKRKQEEQMKEELNAQKAL